MIFKGLQEKVLVPLSPPVRLQNLGKTLKIKAFSGFFVSSAWQKNEGFGTLKTLNRNPILSRGYDLEAGKIKSVLPLLSGFCVAVVFIRHLNFGFPL